MFFSHLYWINLLYFQAYADAGTLNQNYANILLMLLRLRQACDHPQLVKGFGIDSAGRESTGVAKKLSKQKLDSLLKLLETSSAICHACSVSSTSVLFSFWSFILIVLGIVCFFHSLNSFTFSYNFGKCYFSPDWDFRMW